MGRLVFGWEEQAALPELGLLLRAKADTGARTSALQALEPELFGPAGATRVRFLVHAGPGHEAGAPCEAELIDRREITSSNGRAELRWIIRTPVRVGRSERLLEISLTDRRSMACPMLLGREALKAFGALVDPTRTGLHPPARLEPADVEREPDGPLPG